MSQEQAQICPLTFAQIPIPRQTGSSILTGAPGSGQQGMTLEINQVARPCVGEACLFYIGQTRPDQPCRLIAQQVDTEQLLVEQKKTNDLLGNLVKYLEGKSNG